MAAPRTFFSSCSESSSNCGSIDLVGFALFLCCKLNVAASVTGSATAGALRHVPAPAFDCFQLAWPANKLINDYYITQAVK